MFDIVFDINALSKQTISKLIQYETPLIKLIFPHAMILWKRGEKDRSTKQWFINKSRLRANR